MSAWADPERWSALASGERCPICLSIEEEGVCRGTVAGLESGYLATQPEQPLRRYCCLVLKRHAVELHDPKDDEGGAFMRDLRRVGRAVQEVTGAVKMNLEIHGKTIPHVHAHFFALRRGPFRGRARGPASRTRRDGRRRVRRFRRRAARGVEGGVRTGG